MSCKECIESQKTANVFYYRIGNGNIGVQGCKKHVKIMFVRLNCHDDLLAALQAVNDWLREHVKATNRPAKLDAQILTAFANAKPQS